MISLNWKMYNNIVIILNGDILDYSQVKKYIECNDYIIACDGGLKHCKSLDVKPNLILGDFDSVDKELLKEFSKKAEIIKFSKDKDFTDGELGLLKAIELCENYKDKTINEVIIVGGFSAKGRVDHVFGNVFMLKNFAEKGIEAKVVAENSEIYYLSNKIHLNTNKKYLSLIPISEVVEVENSKGLKYDLTSQKFNFGSTRSLSNEPEEEVYISLKSGKALVIVSND